MNAPTPDIHEQPKRLAAARRRRDAGRRPLPADNALLGAARDAPNPRPALPPRVPPPGTHAARLLALLLNRPAGAPEAAAALELTERQVTGLIDRLRAQGWWIEREAPSGRFRLESGSRAN